jgi:hypothetical protein
MFEETPHASGLAVGFFFRLFPSPALGERRHRGLARRLITVRWCAVLVITVGQRPQPRHSHRRSYRLHDATDHLASASTS